MSIITKRLLIKNSILNVGGQIVPLFIAFFTIPYVVSHLGMELFGILSIVWVLIGYFTIFDCSLGTATTKYISESLSKKDKLNINKIYWTSLFLIICLGVIGVCLFCIFIPTLAVRFFIVNPKLLPEIMAVSIIASPLILFLLVKSVFIGTMQAYQRFDIVNIITISNITCSQLAPVWVLFRGKGLKEIIIWLVIIEFVFTLIWFIVSLRIIPERKFRGFLALAEFKKFSFFSFWLIIQRVMNWIQLNIHTVLIGMLISVSMIGYYAIPYSLATKIGLIGAGINPVVFPAASFFDGSNQEKAKRLFYASLKYTVLLYGLGCLLLFIFAKEILVLWMGIDFIKSVFVTRLLAASMFLGGISWILSIFIQINNPRFLSLFSIITAPCYLVVLWFLTKKFSFNGCGYAYLILCVTSTVTYIIYFIKKGYIMRPPRLNLKLLVGIFCLMLILLLNLLIKYIGKMNLPIIIGNIMVLIIGYFVVSWVFFLHEDEKSPLILKMKNLLSVNH